MGWGGEVARLASVTSDGPVIPVQWGLVEVEEGELHPVEFDRRAGVAPHKLEREADCFRGGRIGFSPARSVGSIQIDLAEGSTKFVFFVMISTLRRVVHSAKLPVLRLHGAHAEGIPNVTRCALRRRRRERGRRGRGAPNWDNTWCSQRTCRWPCSHPLRERHSRRRRRPRRLRTRNEVDGEAGQSQRELRWFVANAPIPMKHMSCTVGEVTPLQLCGGGGSSA